MRNNKILIDILFIFFASIVTVLLNQFPIFDEYAGFVLIQLLIAYYFGQFVGKKTKEHQKLKKRTTPKTST
jgi:hypothetical protein